MATEEMALPTGRARVSMETIVSLCKRRGFIFPSSEIYGGLGSCWDYGPLGVELKHNIKEAWWRRVVQQRDDMVGLDAAILMHPQAWVASGHVASFADPLVDCLSCKRRFRQDDLGGATSCPECGGQLSRARPFNLMFRTFLGPIEVEAVFGQWLVGAADEQATLEDLRSWLASYAEELDEKFKTSLVYLRPETAQGIFVNFANVLTSTRRKLPFGIAQIGKAFRNEITPGNFLFRTREFEQMEIEYFVHPGSDEEWFRRWVEERFNWYLELGIRRENLRLRQHGPEELAHYAKACFDIEYLFPMGWAELEGIANRTDFDLRQHSEHSGRDLTYFDEETGEHIVPYVIEPSAGVDRSALAFLVDAYDEEPDKEGIRVVLRLHQEIAPVKVAVLPLSKRERLTALAREVFAEVRQEWVAQYDEVQSIGKRYRRQDEIGTPFCVTIDFQSLEDKAVTIRERDSMAQIRVPIAELVPTLREKLRLGHL